MVRPSGRSASTAVLLASLATLAVIAGVGLAGAAPGTYVTVSAPDEVEADRPVEVTVTVTIPDVDGVNTSTEGTLNLSVDGEPVASRTATVSDGETRTVTFEHAFADTGNHTVTANASTTVFGTTYSAENSTTVSVTAADGSAPPAPLPGQTAPPTDPDADGRYEDVTGDGRFTVVDVGAFLGIFDTDAVRNDAARYDFNDDGAVSVIDVAVLLGEV